MDSSIGYYDVQNVNVIIGGRIITGFDEKTFVECKKDEDNFKFKYSPKGDAAAAKSYHGGGEIKLTLMQTSPYVTYLNSLATKGTMVEAWVKSTNEQAEQYGGTKCVITKPADAKFSDDIESREFVIKVLDYTAK